MLLKVLKVRAKIIIKNEFINKEQIIEKDEAGHAKKKKTS